MRPDYDRSARIAYKTILALNIKTLPIDPLMILRHCNNTAVHTYDDIAYAFGVSDAKAVKFSYADGCDAMTIRKVVGSVPRYEVFYDRRVPATRMRFTLAHELGHVLLKHTMECRFEEQEADYFAGQLLVPHPVFKLFFDDPPYDPGFIAGAFDVSRKAAKVAMSAPMHTRDAEMYAQIQRQFSAIVRPAIDRAC